MSGPNLILPRRKNQLDFVETFPAGIGSIASIIANRVYMHTIDPEPGDTVTDIAYVVGTASGNVDVGILTFDGTTWTIARSSGSVAAAGSSVVQVVPLSASYTWLWNTRYYLYFMADNSTITAQRTGGLQSIDYRNRAAAKASQAFPLAVTIATPAAASGAYVWLAAH